MALRAEKLTAEKEIAAMREELEKQLSQLETQLLESQKGDAALLARQDLLLQSVDGWLEKLQAQQVSGAMQTEQKLEQLQERERLENASAGEAKELLSALAAAAQELLDREEKLGQELLVQDERCAEAKRGKGMKGIHMIDC